MEPPKISDTVKTHVLHWDHFKGELKEKYVYENMTLQQVKEYMCNIHGFEASVGQYQRKFKEWNFFKNNKRKDREDIILSAKRTNSDCDNIDLKGLPNAMKSRFQRALRRYDVPGLQYRRLRDVRPDVLDNRTNSTCVTLWQPQPYTRDLIKLKQLNEHVGQCIEVLPIFLFTSYFQKGSGGNVEILSTGAETVLPLCPGCVSTTLRQRPDSNCDSIKDTEILLACELLTKPEVAMASMVYQVSNNFSSVYTVATFLNNVVKMGVETLLSPILTSNLQTAKAFSQRILAVLFEEVLPSERGPETFRKVFNLLLQTKINVNLTFKSLRSPIFGVPVRVSLLQQSLDIGYLDLAVRLLQAGGDPKWCAEHSDTGLVNRMSCCALHPMVLMFEHDSSQRQNKYDIEDLLKAIEMSDIEYPKDISMMRLTHKHSIMQSLFDQGIEPDSMMSASDKNLSGTGVWYTALQRSVDQRDKTATSILLNAGANPGGCSFRTIASYLQTTKAHGRTKRSETETRRDVYCMLASTSAVTPLSIACFEKNLEMVQLLLHAGAPINGCQFDHCCSRRRSSKRDGLAYYHCDQDCGQYDPIAHDPGDFLAALEHFLKTQAYLSDQSRYGALEYMNEWGFAPILGCAPLQIAVVASRYETVRFLLSCGADMEGCHGLTPLALATCKRNGLLIELLLEFGADPLGFTQHGPYVSAVAVAALMNDVRTMNLLLNNNDRQRSMNRKEVLSPWAATLRHDCHEAYRRLREAMYEGQLVQYPSSIVDMFIATLRFDGENNHLVQSWARKLAPDLDQADGLKLSSYCLINGCTTTLRTLLDLGVNANNANLLAVGLRRTKFDETTRSEGLDMLLEETYGVDSLTAIEALRIIRAELSSDSDTHIRFSIRKLLHRWPTMKPTPGGTEVYAILQVLLSEQFWLAEWILFDRTYQHSVFFPENIFDLILSLLDKVGQYCEHRTIEWEETPIQAAVYMANFDIVRALIKVGANVNAPGAATPISFSERLMQGPLETEMVPRTALQYAVENSDVPMVKLLLEHGADVDAPGSKTIGPTALQIAVMKGDRSMAMLLLDRGANVNEPGSDQFGGSPLQFAIKDEKYNMAQLLLKAGADVNGPCSNAHGRTALQLAVGKKNDELFKLLLEKGADVNQAGAPYFGRTALQLASEIADAELVTQLINHGADVNWPAAHCGGVTALQAAAIRGSFHVCQLLVDAGADVNADGSDIEGRTAIEGAAEHGRLDILTWLLHQSARQFRNQLRDDGDFQLLHAARSASALAKEEGMYHIVDFLDSYMTALVEGKEKTTPPSSNSPRTSDYTRPTQPEPSHAPAPAGPVTTLPMTFFDPEMTQILTDTAAVAPEEFSSWLEEFVNTDMFE